MPLLIKNISDINIINKMDPKISIPVEQQNNIYEITTFWAYLKDSNFLSNPKARYTVKSFGELIENRSKNSFVVSYFSIFSTITKGSIVHWILVWNHNCFLKNSEWHQYKITVRPVHRKRPVRPVQKTAELQWKPCKIKPI